METQREKQTEADQHSRKYARVERERRFLARLPPEPAVRRRRIVDRYLAGTRLRLRRMEDVSPENGPPVFKLTQKIPSPSPGATRGLITNIYLSEGEYEVFAQLPGALLTKVRHSLPPMGIDVFEGELEGLVLAEVEFESDTDSDSFGAPPYVVAEVTSDPRFTGGRLVTASRDELRIWLGEYGLRP